MSTHLHAQGGFSYIELVIVVAIIGILAGTSAPSFLRSKENETLNAASKLITSQLEQTRRTAMQKSSPCYTNIQTSNNSLQTFCADQPTSISELILGEYTKEFSKISLAITSSKPCLFNTVSYPNCIIFTPRGTITAGIDLQIQLDGSALGRCLTIWKPIGLIRSGRLASNKCIYTTSY